MSDRESTAAVFARYAVYQIPGMFVAGLVLVVLLRWEMISQGVAALLFGFWVLKDLILFPITRIGYERGSGRSHGTQALEGSIGVVKEPIVAGGTGWVRLGPELWRARLVSGEGTAGEGARVRVVAVDGLVLAVELEVS